MRIVDLFSGAGGFASGFASRSNGCHIAVDIDPFALDTYRLNYPEATILHRNINSLHSLELEHIVNGQPDVIIASPPCEEFSRANSRSFSPARDRIYGTGTARLVLDAIRIIGDLSPQVFIIENVAGILESGGRKILCRELHRVGIDTVYFNLIRAHRHGNPSRRLRVFISNLEFRLPTCSTPKVMEAIGDLPPMNFEALFTPENEVPNHTFVHISEAKMKRVRKTGWGRGVKHFRVSKEKAVPNWVRFRPNQIATSIIGNSRYIHPFENRLLTVREHARLMSYPDSFLFSGPTDSQYNQVGESVPPVISHLIAKEVETYLEE